MLRFVFLGLLFGLRFRVLDGLANHVVHDLLLLLRQGVEHVLHGLFALRLLGLGLLLICHRCFLLFLFRFGLGRGLRLLVLLFLVLRRLFGVGELQALRRGVNDRLVIGRLAGMRQHRVFDDSPVIGPGQHHAHLTNLPMHHVAAVLGQVIGVNRKRSQILMSHGFLHQLPILGVIALRIGVHPLAGPILQKSVPQHILGISMLMLIHQRDRLTVVLPKRPVPDGSAVGAKNVILRRPSGKVKLFSHFDLLLPLACLSAGRARLRRLRHRRGTRVSRLIQIAVSQLIGPLVIHGLVPQGPDPELVRAHDLIAC